MSKSKYLWLFPRIKTCSNPLEVREIESDGMVPLLKPIENCKDFEYVCGTKGNPQTPLKS